MGISVTDPISPAIERAKWITFKPFDLGKWFVMGFISWIATLGEGGGGGNFNSFNNSTPRPPTPPPPPVPTTTTIAGVRIPATQPAPPDPFHQVWTWVVSHLAITIAIVAAAFLLIMAIAIVLTWISSRGKFMFLRAVATNTAEVKAPWAQYRDHGNSLFGFRVRLMLIGFALLFVIGAIALGLALPDIKGKHFGAPSIIAMLAGILLFLPSMIILGLVNWAMNTFGTIIMYTRTVSANEAWREFRFAILPGNKGKFGLFLLMQALLGIAVGIMSMIAGCVTCCLGFLPYLSSVVTLPLAIFWRCYSVYFFQQFGPEYMILEPPAPPTPPAIGFPVTPYPPQWTPPPPPGQPPQYPSQ